MISAIHKNCADCEQAVHFANLDRPYCVPQMTNYLLLGTFLCSVFVVSRNQKIRQNHAVHA